MFGILKPPIPLVGGAGTSYLAGKTVLKPVDNEEETIWKAELMDSIMEDGFRVARLLKTMTGQWIHNGWQASAYVQGHELKGRWEEKIAISRKFHQALRYYAEPSFIAKTTHPWGIADRMVWGEQPLVYGPGLESVMKRLQALMRPIALRSQLIHGDMTGNILFDETLPPAVIDLSPYSRPADYATAIIVADSIVWEGAPDSLMDHVTDDPGMYQLLVRAAMWRIITTELCIKAYGRGNLEEIDAYRHFIDMLSNGTGRFCI